MAFPAVQGTPAESSSSGTATSHTVALPTGIVSGEALFVFFGTNAGLTIGWPAGWTEVASYDPAATRKIAVARRIADGTEGASITVTTSSADRFASISYRISGHNSGEVAFSATANSGSDDLPNPPSLTPSWGAADTLWFAFGTSVRSDATAAPTNYTDLISPTSDGTFNACTFTAKRNLNAASDDPGTFTLNSARNWIAATMAVRPTSGTTITGTGAITTTVPTISGSGTREVTGTGAISATVPAIAGSGVREAKGDGSISAPVPVISGSGVREAKGDGAILAPVPVIAGSGVVGSEITGTGAISATVPTIAGSGIREITGAGSISAPIPTIAGAGIREITGAGSISAPIPTIAGAGTRQVTGTGSIAAPVPIIVGAGIRQITGTGSISAPVPIIAGAGIRQITGTGSISAPIPVIAGSGDVIAGVTGDGSISAPVPIIAGVGTREAILVGAITAPVPIISGSGSVIHFVPEVTWFNTIADTEDWTVAPIGATVWTKYTYDDDIWT